MASWLVAPQCTKRAACGSRLATLAVRALTRGMARFPAAAASRAIAPTSKNSARHCDSMAAAAAEGMMPWAASARARAASKSSMPCRMRRSEKISRKSPVEKSKSSKFGVDRGRLIRESVVAALGSRRVGRYGGGGNCRSAGRSGLSLCTTTECLRSGLSRMIRADAEEAFAARSATVGGKKQQALQTDKHAVFNTIARNLLEVQVSAGRTVHVERCKNRDFPCKKATIAGATAPRAQIHERKQEVHNAAAVRPIGPIALATWADHCKGTRFRTGAVRMLEITA